MISPFEVLKGSVVSFEGKAYVVQGVNEYILLVGRKEWIGGSLVNGEPISPLFLTALGFTEYVIDDWYRQRELMNWSIRIARSSIGEWIVYQGFVNQWGQLRRVEYIHQLQIIFFALTGEFLHLSKIKKG